MAEMTQEELVQEVLDRVLQSSTGVEDLETAPAERWKSLPGEKTARGERPPGTDREACERCRPPCRGCRQESGRSRSRKNPAPQAQQANPATI